MHGGEGRGDMGSNETPPGRMLEAGKAGLLLLMLVMLIGACTELPDPESPDAAVPGTGERGRSLPTGSAPPRIVVDSGPMLVGTEGSGLAEWAVVLPLTAGGFAAGPTLGEHQVLIYTPEGRLRHGLGGPGEGPGEFSDRIRPVPFRGDSLAVFDAVLSRVSYLDPLAAGGEFRSVTLPVRPALFPFANWIRAGGDWVTTGIGTDRILAEGPFHRISTEGELLASFGGTYGAFRSDQPWGAARAITARGDTIWALSHNAYQLEAWSLAGELLDTLIMDADWFPTWREPDPAAPFGARPHAEAMALWADANGLLWLVVLTASEQWAPYPPEARNRDFDAAFINEIHGTRLEVLDPSTREVIAQISLEGRLRPTGVDGWLYRTGFSPAGDLYLQPLRLSLDGEDPVNSSFPLRPRP